MGAFVPGMNVGDLVASAATGALPQGGQAPQGMTTMGPAPLQAPQPLPRFQPPQVQYGKAGNEFQTASGRKRADQEALFHSIAGMIKSGGDYIQAKKNRMLQSSIERLMSAQAGIEEAKQMDPNDPKAKEAIAKNTAIINDITADPKTSKQLQKAFNIDLFGNGKNKNENQALVKAWQEFSQKQKAGDQSALNPVAQRLINSQPIRQQLDPQAALQAQAIKLGLIPDANHQSTATWQNLRTYMEAKTGEARIASAEKIAQDREKAASYRSDRLFDAQLARIMGAKDIADIKARSQVIHDGKVMAMWDQKMEILKGQSGRNPIFKGLASEAKTYLDQMKQMRESNKSMQAELDKKIKMAGPAGWLGITKNAVADADAEILRNQIQVNNLLIASYEQKLNGPAGVMAKIKNLNEMGMINMGADEAEQGTEDNPLPGPNPDEQPE